MANEIHPTALISDGVTLGEGNVIGPFAVITGSVQIGDGNWIGAGTVIGAPPEVRSFDHRSGGGAGVVIGSNNTIREYAQVHEGSIAPTWVGDGSFLMNQIYIAHDGWIGDGVTLASSVLLAGHVRVESAANLGLGTIVHQFRRVGTGAMVGMGAVVTRDVPPYCLTYGSPATVRGANRVGLQRAGAEEEVIEALHRGYAAGETYDVIRARLPQDAIAALELPAGTASSL